LRRYEIIHSSINTKAKKTIKTTPFLKQRLAKPIRRHKGANKGLQNQSEGTKEQKEPSEEILVHPLPHFDWLITVTPKSYMSFHWYQ